MLRIAPSRNSSPPVGAPARIVAVLVLMNAALLVPVGRLHDASVAFATMAVALVAWMALWVNRPGNPTPWRWIVAGLALNGLGSLTSFACSIVGVNSDATVADIPWLASYVALGAGALCVLLRRPAARRFDVDSLVDVAVIAVVALTAIWPLVLQPALTDRSLSWLGRLVAAGYPVADMILLSIIVRAFASKRSRSIAGPLLLVGMGAWLLADVGFITVSPSYFDVGRWVEAGWLVGASLVSFAVWIGTWKRPAPAGEETADDESERGVGQSQVVLAIVPLVLPAIIDVAAEMTSNEHNARFILVATLALAGLALVRSLRLLRMKDAAQATIAATSRYYEALAANSSDAVVVIGADGRLLTDVRNLDDLSGFQDVNVAGLPVTALFAEETRADAEALFHNTLIAPFQPFDAELRLQEASGRELWVAARAVNLLDDPDVHGVVMNIHDITGRRQAEADLSHLAFHDPLTGLANRALFGNRVEHALHLRRASGLDSAVLFLDVDGFKRVNDSLGHPVGDALLRQVAVRLSAAVRAGDTVARFGGDEFAILIEQAHRPMDEATAAAQRILDLFSTPFDLGELTVAVSASVGVAVAGPDSTAASLLRNADMAMYSAKANGKGCYVLYSPQMRTAAFERLQIENDMIDVADSGQLRVVYQPVVALETEEIVGFEALVRWDHPVLGTVSPERFVPIAEENGLIIPIGEWVLSEACHQAAAWRARFPDQGLTMAVNLSARQLACVDLVAQVRRALRESGLEPSSLVLEMTETVLVRDMEIATQRLHELRGLGVRLAIDDFGTGYSSLSYLRQFPVDILKIDRSFINTITDRGQVPAIVRGLLDLGRTLELETIAEGVEMESQRTQLRDEHCDLAQGYLFAKPLPPEEAEQLLRRLAPVTSMP